MEKLDYGTMLSPYPIVLSIGTLRKPRLSEIADDSILGFGKFSYYQTLIRLTPEIYFEKLANEELKKEFNSLDDDKRSSITMFDIVARDEQLSKTFLDMFNFFFVEKVVLEDGIFVLLDPQSEDRDITKENFRGAIIKEIFDQVLDIIQQICCIHEDTYEEDEEASFKNSLAKRLYDKMLKARKEAQKRKSAEKEDKNYSLPNIISAVSNKHPTINPINVYDLTLFQLIDSFNRLQVNSIYEIDSTRVSVWGDEKNTFDVSLWHKNEYDKQAVS